MSKKSAIFVNPLYKSIYHVSISKFKTTPQEI